MRNNQYILGGYRVNFDNPKRLIRSLFMLHNETVNIWSHLLGVFFFLFLIYYTFFYLAPPEVKPTTPELLPNGWFESAHNEMQLRDRMILAELIQGQSASS